MNSLPQTTGLASDALPLRTRLLYASSSLGSEALSQSRGLWLLYYYAPPEDADLETIVPRVALGVLLTVGRLLEAFDDALIGYWSDRTRSRLGRRIPFVLGATPFWALFAVLLFTPPTGSAVGSGIYLFVCLELFYVFSTLSGGPYEALIPELARTSRDRVSLVAFRVYFGAAGAAVGLVGSGLLRDAYGFKAMALAMAGVALVFRYVGLAGAWSRALASQAPAELGFREAMRATFENRGFLAFLPTFVLFQIGFQMLVGMLPFYVNAVLGIEDEGTWVAVLTAVAIGSMVVSVPFFGRFAAITSKKQAYSWAMLGAACSFPLLFFAGFVPGVSRETQILIMMVLAGSPLAGLYLFPAALTADIVDDDTTRTGHRREATYYGAQNFVEKTATSVSPLLLALLLLLGDSAENPLGIRLIGPFAGLLVLAGFLRFRSYDLPDEPAAAR